MPRGGARPGAGRKADPNSARSRARAAKAAASAAEGFTAPDGSKTKVAPTTWPFGTSAPSPQPPLPPAEAAPPVAPPSADLSELTPLAFLLERMRDPLEDMRTRFQAAQLAAPFIHAKPAPAGKKGDKDLQKKPASGRFAAAAAPRLVSSR
jgi:hypothetical protein